MGAVPAQSYSIHFSALLSASGDGVLRGYAVTKSADGLSYVVASTANLAVSSSGKIHGVALQDGNAGRTIQIQRDAEVDKSNFGWITTGGIENAVVDSNGKVQRASVASGATIGVFDQEGNCAINMAGSGAVASLTLAGDVNGPTAANQVWSISGNAGAVSILGGAWTIAATVALALTQPQATGDVRTKDIAFHTQPASATSTSDNRAGGSFIVDLGASNKTLDADNDPLAPAVDVFYGGVQIAAWRATRFWGATGVGCGLELNWNDNSWIAIGETSALTLGVIAVNNNVDAVAARNFLNTDDIVIIGSDTSDRVVLGRYGAAAIKAVPLAGTGTRAVTADSTGVLGSTAIQAAPTGSGVWHSTAGALDGAASVGAANQVFVTNGAGTDTAWSTTGGDVTGAITALVVGKLQGSIVLSGTPSSGQVLQATSSTAATWATISTGTSVTWAQDLVGSTNTSQIVVALTGTSGVTTVRSSGATNAIAFGTTGTAAAGDCRHKNAVAICYARNAAGSADLALLSTDASNFFYVGGTSSLTLQPTITYLQASSNIRTIVGSTQILDITATTTSFSGSTFAFGSGVVTHGSSVAGSGDFRVKNGWLLNGLATTDRTLLTLDASGFMGVGGNTSLANQVAIAYLQATNNVYLCIGASAAFSVQSGQVSVQPGNNFSVGTQSPTMNGAQNTIFVTDAGVGHYPSAGPSGGCYVYSRAGCFHIRGSYSSTGVPLNINLQEVTGGFGAIDPDHAIQIVIDKPGLSDAVRYIRLYT